MTADVLPFAAPPRLNRCHEQLLDALEANPDATSGAIALFGDTRAEARITDDLTLDGAELAAIMVRNCADQRDRAAGRLKDRAIRALRKRGIGVPGPATVPPVVAETAPPVAVETVAEDPEPSWRRWMAKQARLLGAIALYVIPVLFVLLLYRGTWVDRWFDVFFGYPPKLLRSGRYIVGDDEIILTLSILILTRLLCTKLRLPARFGGRQTPAHGKPLPGHRGWGSA